MARSRRRLGVKMPGVSTSRTWLSPRIRMPRTRKRVVCALGVTMESLAPVRRFSSVDLPALGAPTMATKPQRWVIGRRSSRAAAAQAFGVALAGAAAFAALPGALDLDGEDGGVGGAGAGGLDVVGQGERAGHEPFLQRGLRVLGRADLRVHRGGPGACGRSGGRVQPGVEEQRADRRLHRVGQRVGELADAGARLAGADGQGGVEAEALRRSRPGRGGTPGGRSGGRARLPARAGSARSAIRRRRGRARGRR